MFLKTVARISDFSTELRFLVGFLQLQETCSNNPALISCKFPAPNHEVKTRNWRYTLCLSPSTGITRFPCYQSVEDVSCVVASMRSVFYTLCLTEKTSQQLPEHAPAISQMCFCIPQHLHECLQKQQKPAKHILNISKQVSCSGSWQCMAMVLFQFFLKLRHIRVP